MNQNVFSKERLRIYSIILISVAVISDIVKSVVDACCYEFIWHEMGYLFFSAFLGFGLIISLLRKKPKSIEFMLDAYKVFDSVYYSQLFFVKLEEGFLTGSRLALGILYGIAALFLFISFIFFMIGEIRDVHWTRKYIKVGLLIASVLMLAAGIISISDPAYGARSWIISLECFTNMLLYMGFFVCYNYAE